MGILESLEPFIFMCGIHAEGSALPVYLVTQCQAVFIEYVIADLQLSKY